MGEGGAVLTNTPTLKKLVESFRDWGRDCWCLPGEANTCGKRFDWQLAPGEEVRPQLRVTFRPNAVRMILRDWRKS